MSFLEAFFSHWLLVTSLLAGILSSILSGMMGSYVVVKRIVFIAGSISHSVLGGIGLAVFLQRVYGWSFATPFLGALVAGIFSALLIGWIRLKFRQREDSVIAALWSCGMAAGVLFLAITPGYTVELSNFFVGNILWVTQEDLMTLVVLDLLVLGVVFLFHERFLAICFDEEQAKMQGLPVDALYLLLLVLIAVSVVVLVQIVGIVLVLTILTIPAAIANLFTVRLSSMMLLATFLSAFFCTGGLWIAFDWDLPPGALIALLSGFSYLLLLQGRSLVLRLKLLRSS